MTAAHCLAELGLSPICSQYSPPLMPKVSPTIQQDRGCLPYETQVITMPPSESSLLGVSKLEHPGLKECNQQLFTLLPKSSSSVPSSTKPSFFLCPYPVKAPSACFPANSILKGSVLHHQVCLLYLAQLLLYKSLSVDRCHVTFLSCSTPAPAPARLNTQPVSSPGRQGQGRGLRYDHGKCPCSARFMSLKETTGSAESSGRA